MNLILLRRILVACFFCLVSLEAWSAPSSQWSVRFLGRAANVLLAAADNEKEKLCGIASADVSMLSQSLKSLLDEKTATLQASQITKIKKDSAACETECTCPIYHSVLEARGEKALLSEIEKKSQEQTPQQILQCAKKFPEFCQSELLKYLRKNSQSL